MTQMQEIILKAAYQDANTVLGALMDLAGENVSMDAIEVTQNASMLSGAMMMLRYVFDELGIHI